MLEFVKPAVAAAHDPKWWRTYWFVPVLILAAIGVGITHHFVAFWPFFLSIFLIALLAHFKYGIVKYASLCGTFVLVAYVIYEGQQPTTVIAPFALPSQGDSAKLPFTGETVSNVVRDGLNTVGKVAIGEPARFPCPSTAVYSDISHAFTPQDVALGVDLLPQPPEPFAALAPPPPEEPVTLEVKGVSLEALLSAVRTVLHTERLISGDLIADGTGSFFLVARSNKMEGPWTVGPFPATKDGLQSAGCQMAQYILTTVNPNLLGEAYIKGNRSLDTILLYSEQVSSDVQNSHDALLLDGAARMKQKQYPAAIYKFRRALQTNKDDAGVLESLGLAYAGARDFDNAFSQFDLALQCPPLSLPCSLRARNNYARGVTYFLKQDYDQSVTAFQRALQAKPGYIAADFYLGEAFQESKKYSDAIKAYQAALTAGPSHPSDTAIIQLQLGNAFDLNGQWEKAIAAYEQTAAHFLATLVLDSEDLAAYYTFAVVDLRIGTVQSQHQQQDQAQASFDRAAHSLTYVLNKEPQYPGARTYLMKAHLLRGNALQAQNKDEPAIDELSTAISEIQKMPDPPDPDQLLTLGMAYVVRGNVYLRGRQDARAAADAKQALEACNRIPESDPKNGQAKQCSASALALNAHVETNVGHAQKAIVQLTLALKLYSPYPEASRALGMIYFDLGSALAKSAKNLDEAQRDFSAAIDQFTLVRGRVSDGYLRLGAAYLQSAIVYEIQDRHPEAKKACDNAIDAYKQVPEAKPRLPDLEAQCAALGTKH